MGGMGGFGGMRDMGSHRAPVPTPPLSSSSLFSSDEAYRAYTFPDHIPSAIPSVVFPHDVPSPSGGHPHVPTSVASPTAPAVSPLRSLPRGNISTSSASDLTLLGWPPSAVRLLPLSSLLLRHYRLRRVLLLPPLLWLLLPSPLSALRSLSSFPRSKTRKVTWTSTTKLPTTFALRNMAPAALTTFFSLILPTPRPVAIGKVNFGLLFGMGSFVFSSRTLGPVSTGKVLKCWMSSIATAALIRSQMLSLP